MFASEGVEAVTMRKIADRIEYSATAIYQYFPDKEALLREICERDFAALAQQSLRVAASPIACKRCAAGPCLRGIRPGASAAATDCMFMTRKAPSRTSNAGAFRARRVRAPPHGGAGMHRAGTPRQEVLDAELVAQTLWAGVHGASALCRSRWPATSGSPGDPSSRLAPPARHPAQRNPAR